MASSSSLSIAMVLDTYDDARNGAVISTQRFTRLLREHDNKVIVVSTGIEEQDKVILKEFYPPIPFVERIMKRMKFVFAWPDKSLLSKTFEQVDIIHNQFTFILGYQTVKLAKQLNKPVISSFHVQAEQIANNLGLKKQWIVTLIYKIFIKYIYNRSDVVLCPSKFAETEIKRYGCTVPTVVISNGVTENYKNLHLEKDSSVFTILTVGRNAPEKRQHLLIEAVAQSKYRTNIEVQIIGDGPKRTTLVDLANKLLPNQVEFNYIPTNQVINYYNRADLYVHCAAVEVECMTALEAMACGLPLLIANSDLSATKQFAIDDNFLFNTREELTAKIDYLYENRTALAKAQQQYAEKVKQYSIENSYKKLIDAYHYTISLVKKTI